MKRGLFFMLLFNTQFLFAQTKSDTSVLVSVGLGLDKVKERQEKINAFADSINNYTTGALPEFLLDECFDNQVSLWEGFHSPISLRWKILEKVSDKDALKQILATHDKRLKRKCRYNRGSNPEIIIPMIRKSFYQLLQKRYRQL